MSAGLNWRATLRTLLPPRWYFRLKRIKEETQALLSRDDLTALATIYKTDKWGAHAYTPIYDQWFHALRNQNVRLLEIGVGGFTKAHFGGNSLRMWKRYFPKGRITGIDIYDKTEFEEKRIRIYTGDQADAAFLEKVNQAEGPFDIIIDDGSHKQSDILASLATLFPLLKPGGIYVIEDTQTSYWERYEGSTSRMNNVASAMNFFIDRVHQVNRPEWEGDEVPVDMQHDAGIASISFYHNLIIVVKRNEL